jgi:C4-dicarboxylate-specific signal transduction histidine kinase
MNSVFKYHISKIPTSICELNLSEDLDSVYKIPKQLEIPLFNVIENALDELFEMRKLDIDFIPFMKINTLVFDSILKIEIEDNGGGIDREIQNTLFEAFTTTKEEYGGLGLGLYISQEIIKDLKGSIECCFTNEMTKFIIKIPLFKRSE